MIAVFGSTGKVGGKVAAMLLESEIPVRVLVRSEEKAAPIRNKGAEVVVGTMANPKDVARTLDRCDSAFLMSPLNPTREDYVDEEVQIGRNYGAALTDSTVSRVVYLSVWKVRDNTDIPFFESKALIEDSIVSAHVSPTFLRPSMFMENLYMQMPGIRDDGLISLPLPADRPLPWVAVEDIAYAAVQSLKQPSAEPMKAYNMLGPRNYTLSEITEIVGEAIDKPLRYREMSDDEARQVFSAGGFSVKAVDGYLGFMKSMRTLEATEDRTRVYDDLNFEPTSFETFAATFAGMKVGSR